MRKKVKEAFELILEEIHKKLGGCINECRNCKYERDCGVWEHKLDAVELFLREKKID